MEATQTSNNDEMESDIANNDTAEQNASDLSDNEINALVDEVTPSTTKRSTVWGAKVFQKWQEKRQIEVDLNTISAEDLAVHLKKFYAEVKKKKWGTLHTKRFSWNTCRYPPHT